jgi:hypothetical protein
MDDFYERALSSLTQRIALSNDGGGDRASDIPNAACTFVSPAVTPAVIPTTDDVGELESHAKSLVEDDVPKIDRAVRNYLALVAARSCVASDVDVLYPSHSSSLSSTTTATTLLAASVATSGRPSSRAESAGDVNRRSLLCARALLVAINSTIIPILDDDGDDEQSGPTIMMQLSQKNAATRILWNSLVIQSSSRSSSDSSSIDDSSAGSETKRRTNKPSNVLGRQSLIVAYPYIQERLRRGGRTDIDANANANDVGIDSYATLSPPLSDEANGSPRSKRWHALRSLSSEVLPPAFPPIGIDLDQWESFYVEFGRLLLPAAATDDGDDIESERAGPVRQEERRRKDQERPHRDDDSALLWSKDGGLAELRSRREDRSRRALLIE